MVYPHSRRGRRRFPDAGGMLRRERPRLARRLVDQHERVFRGGDADVVDKQGLVETDRRIADPRNGGADFDLAGPVHFAPEINRQVRQYEACARYDQPILIAAQDDDTPRFEKRRKHRIVNVILPVEIAEADGFDRAVRKVFGPGSRAATTG